MVSRMAAQATFLPQHPLKVLRAPVPLLLQPPLRSLRQSRLPRQLKAARVQGVGKPRLVWTRPCLLQRLQAKQQHHLPVRSPTVQLLPRPGMAHLHLTRHLLLWGKATQILSLTRLRRLVRAPLVLTCLEHLVRLQPLAPMQRLQCLTELSDRDSSAPRLSIPELRGVGELLAQPLSGLRFLTTSYTNIPGYGPFT